MKVTSVLLGGFVAATVAAPLDGHIIHEKRNVAHPRWVKREPLDADTNIPVRIALKQRNLDKGMDFLMDVSDPRSENYGRHYTQDEVVERFAPDEESIAKVKRWLVEAGIPERSINVPRSKGWVQFNARTEQLESMLLTKYHVYDHAVSRSEHVGTDKYHLPRDISSVVDFITPGVAFGKRHASPEKRSAGIIAPNKTPVPQELIQKLKAAPQDTSNCDEAITPPCILAQYNISAPTLAASGNNIGIYEDEDVVVLSDLNTFYKDYAPQIPQGTKPVQNSINGAQGFGTTGQAEGEADLDFQIAYPLIYPQGAQLFQVNTGDSLGLFNTFLDAVDGSYCTFSADGETGDDPSIDPHTAKEQCGAYKPTHVISFSYGESENDYPASYLERQCTEFMKLGLQGTSLVIASGDDGVATRDEECLGPKKDIFVPDTPADCPYVTAVGATILPKGTAVGGEETASVSFSSGGGFSNVFTTPDYQSDAVSSYFANHKPSYPSYKTSNGTIPTTGGIYNSAGRGYPDVSALGENGVFIINGEEFTTGGTSMAAPIVASVFNRINEELIAAGKPVIGFANPVLYQNPQMFNDITVGNQALGGPNSDGQPSACGNDGFSAVSGWDPVTGLGTPNYPAMLKVFMSQ